MRWLRPAGFWEPPFRSAGASLLDAAIALACIGLAYVLVDFAAKTRGPRVRLAVECAFGIGLPFAALAFASVHPFVDGMRGDGYRWLRAAAEPEFLPSEPLGRYAHHLVFLAMRGLGVAGDSSVAVRSSSCVAGAAAALALAWYAPRAFPRGDVLSVVALVFFAPTAVLHFGYPETTPWAYAWLTAYLCAGLAYFHTEDTGSPVAPCCFLALALITHGLVLFACASYAVLLATHYRRAGANRRVARTALLAILPFVPLASALLFAAATRTDDPSTPAMGNALGGGDARMWVVAPGAVVEDWNGVTFVYRFFGRLHREGLTMLAVFAAPAILLAPRALLGIARTAPAGSERANVDASRFLALAGAGLLALPFAWNADLGMLRDFDLMAAFAVPAQMLAVHALVSRVDGAHQRTVVLSVVPFVWAFLLRPWLSG